MLPLHNAFLINLYRLVRLYEFSVVE